MDVLTYGDHIVIFAAPPQKVDRFATTRGRLRNRHVTASGPMLAPSTP